MVYKEIFMISENWLLTIFFRIPSYTIKPEYLEESEMIPTDSYETISEIKDFETKTVHKYVLLENI